MPIDFKMPKMTKLEKKVYKLLWKEYNSGYILVYDDECLLAFVQYLIKMLGIKNE